MAAVSEEEVTLALCNGEFALPYQPALSRIINDLPIREPERKLHWPLGRRPEDH